MTKLESLKKSSHFTRVLKHKVINNDFFTVYRTRNFIKKTNNTKKLFISFIMKKKIGNAVKRNKIRRKLKSIIQKLLKMNRPKDKIVEVTLLSRNSSDTGLRIFNSIEKNKLDITRAVFSGGESPFPYVDALDIDLFLSADVNDVKVALENNIAAAHIFTENYQPSKSKQLRIGFDADAVIFSDESEITFKKKGLKTYLKD